MAHQNQAPIDAIQGMSGGGYVAFTPTSYDDMNASYANNRKDELSKSNVFTFAANHPNLTA